MKGIVWHLLVLMEKSLELDVFYKHGFVFREPDSHIAGDKLIHKPGFSSGYNIFFSESAIEFLGLNRRDRAIAIANIIQRLFLSVFITQQSAIN
jgi:hypothetical protein